MSLELDARQRAMLAELGVRVWLPEPTPPAGPAAAAVPPPRPAETAVVAAVPAPPSPARMSRPAATAPASAPPDGTAGLRPGGADTLDWPALEAAVAGCRACGLCERRHHTVFGVGDRQADWMVIGEAPGEQEDLRGEPFVGPAGRLLDAMLRAIGLSRAAGVPDAGGAPAAPAAPGGEPLRPVYIANALKCRPPGNRNPQPDEMAQCEPFLRRQVALVRPKIILLMGRFAVQAILQTHEPIGRLRGRVHRWQGVPVVVTYHPAYLLRNLPDKAKAWADLCLALEHLTTPGAGTPDADFSPPTGDAT